MFEYLKKIFSDDRQHDVVSNPKEIGNSKSKKIKVAACALFIEMAKADGEYSEEERDFIISEMQKTFNLEQECVTELMELAERQLKESVSLYEFTGIINATFSQEQKIELIESLWKLIYRDEKLNAYEDHLIKRIAGTLNVEHREIINAKLWVKSQMGLK
jgi:uncharacterized tellurite resistance protein B-like protein